jgi:flagellin-like hook-associated protein FlgL
MYAHRRSLTRLSSGNRIVNPADDAGGLAVGNKLDSKLIRLEKVHQNLKNTISFTELQESALRTVGTIITRMSELKTMSTDVTKNSADIENYNKEFVELQKQIEAMTKHKFNGVSLFSNTSKFAETDADGRSGHGVDLARNFVFDEYVAQSGAVLGQGTSSTTTVPGGGGSSTTYSLDQWRADYDEWINYDDSNWDNDFLTWMADPEPYGGAAVLNQIKAARNSGATELAIHVKNISDITPLAGLGNLKKLIISDNNITDLSPIAALANLEELSAATNNISSLEPLAGLTSMWWLSIGSNTFTNIEPLRNLTNLTNLNLANNIGIIDDYSPITAMTNMDYLVLVGNDMTQEQQDLMDAAISPTSLYWGNIVEAPEEPETPSTTGTGYPSLDQFTTEDFTNFTQSVASAMAEVGSHQSRLNMEVRQNEAARVNLEAAKSRIMDADMARESTRYARTNVLIQSSASMVAQANKLSDIALRLMINR